MIEQGKNKSQLFYISCSFSDIK